MTDERPYGIYMWIFLIIGIFTYVVICDVWLHRHGHEMMTTEFREGLVSPVWGPVLTGLWFALFIGLTYHFFYQFFGK